MRRRNLHDTTSPSRSPRDLDLSGLTPPRVFIDTCPPTITLAVLYIYVRQYSTDTVTYDRDSYLSLPVGSLPRLRLSRSPGGLSLITLLWLLSAAYFSFHNLQSRVSTLFPVFPLRLTFFTLTLLCSLAV